MKMYRYLSFILLINILCAADEGLSDALAQVRISAAKVSITHHDCNGLCGDHDCEEARRHTPTGRGASGKWLDKVTPKRGWTTRKLEDLETPSLTCQMCERETIRYVHIMSHPRYREELSVGCICAGYMIGDIPGAKRHESDLQNQLSRRQTFLTAVLKTSKGGKHYINVRTTQTVPKRNVVFVRSQYGQYTFVIDNERSNIWKPSLEAARKVAADVLFSTHLTLN